MRHFGLGAALGAAILLSACDDTAGTGGGPHHGGRYVGIGLYAPSALWSRLAGVPRPSNPQAATLDDDNAVIVVVDSQTGEIRQCGNLSGHCIAMNPWSGQSAAASLTAHSADLSAQEMIDHSARNASRDAPGSDDAAPDAPRRRPDHP